MTPSPGVIEAAAFTVGCALIHALREHADRVTRALFATLVAVTLVFVTIDSLTFDHTDASGYDLLGALRQGP
ncbi:hypothetical protein [Methylobacterium durans]|uniref:Uncharacterized protein n=1 Tax=Methylobacterium durans TaxID=2202825 RepID=A0A2U8WBS1_9HYPH|nr:hypothetical protein [Methylobacterium durans]AWN42766.1 hypothetical protein DK389_22510 [Methylobacterium durans]